MSVSEDISVSVTKAGLLGRCPRCGKGKLFAGFLDIAPKCGKCELDYGFADAGDGPAIFVIFFAGFVLLGGALAVEVMYRPPYWLHAALWLPLGIMLPLLLLRPFKATFVALQYQRQARLGQVDGRRAEDRQVDDQ